MTITDRQISSRSIKHSNCNKTHRHRQMLWGIWGKQKENEDGKEDADNHVDDKNDASISILCTQTII